jgi:hypothetical protein
MNKEFIDRVARAVYEDSRELDDELDGSADESDDESEGSAEYLMRRCGIDPGSSSSLVATCTRACIPDYRMSADEWLEYLEGAVSEERMLELEDGGDLTPEEEYLARKDYCESELGNGYFTVTRYYRVTDSQGRPIFFSSDHGDGGYLLDADGPWKKMPDMTGGFDGECLRQWTVFPDRDLSAERELAASLTKGRRVRHPQFGSGTVIELSSAGKYYAAVIIDFDTVGRKRLVTQWDQISLDS